MDAKSIPEVAFEWLCECGAFDQLRKQCECYTADFTEKTVYRFVLEMDLMQLLDFNATLGNLVITKPLNAINVFQEVCFVTIRTLSWIPGLMYPSQILAVVRFSSVSPCQEFVNSKNLARYGRSNLVKIVGIVTGTTAVTQYTQSARFYCPQSECFGSAKYCYIRVHLAGKTENVTVRSDFECKYCGSSLIEDVTCRTLADKCIVQVISPATVNKKLWINDEGKFYQAIPIHVRDELIKEVQIGCYFSFVVLPSCEIHDSSVHFLCTPVFEANNIEKINPSPFLSLMPSKLPERIEMLYKDRQDSPWSFVASLAYCFGGCVTPPGTFFQLKMFMLMCLLLHSSDSSEDAKRGQSRNLHLLVIANDLLRIQRLLLYGASFAKRMLVYSPISELFPSFSRDPYGSDTCMVNAGCIPLATDGICVIHNMAVLKKDQKEKLQNALENGSVTVKVPEKYWACQGYQLSIPLSCSLWVCSEPAPKTGPQQAVLDPMLYPGHMIRDCPTLPRTFVDQFSLVLNLNGSVENVDNSDESVSEEMLRKAMEDPADVESSYIRDEEMDQFLCYAGRHHTILTVEAQDLIQGYYLANRRTRNSHSTGGTDFAASALQTLTSLAISHAQLSLRSEVLEEDAVVAIVLYEDSIKWKYGFSALGPVDPPSPGEDASEFFGPKNDCRMKEIHGRIRRFCSSFKDGFSTYFGAFSHEE